MDNAKLQKIADNIRILSLSMPERAKSGHPGGPMGGADFMALLYAEFLRFDPKDMTWVNRDRFFLDAGHLSSMLYSTLSTLGAYSMDDLMNFRQWNSPTPGHPEHDVHRGVENTSGPLGQGHVMGLGSAIAERFLRARFGDWMEHKTVAYISDGGVEEEVSQGVGRLAGHLGMSNLILFYDSNDVQLSHMTKDTMSENTAMKYQSWGWNVETVDGHDFEAMRGALKRAWSEKSRPTFIVGKTIMGKGAVRADGSKYEGSPKLHGVPLSKTEASVERTIQVLGGDPANPFVLFPEVKEAMAAVLAEKSKAAAEAKAKQAAWEKQNPELARKFQQFFTGELPPLDFASIEQKPNEATRAASKNVLAYLAGKVENMIVTSADLADSDYTEGFLKKTKIFTKDDFSGSFLQAGVAELTMAGIMNGIALHGGCYIAGGTFFAFSDFQKPAIRLAAIMGAHTIYIWTHDAFRVGEDGPTHQPIEQEAQIRLLEKMANLEGHRSALVLRPCDGAETTVAWKMALEAKTPTGLILTRQPVNDAPAKSGSTRYQDALLGAAKGAYIVREAGGKPDLVLVANGSEVSLLLEGAEKLVKEKGIKVQVVSAISEGLFREQAPQYRESVLPLTVPTLGWTAGLPATLQGLVGPLGKVYGMERFGASAPFKVLDEKFGYTPANVVAVAERYLSEYKDTARRIATAVG
ncbi:MAG TPA: transketolase [Fibrobacteria bacterium]|nr:transketolase [Fibrobacteria bacterium]